MNLPLHLLWGVVAVFLWVIRPNSPLARGEKRPTSFSEKSLNGAYIFITAGVVISYIIWRFVYTVYPADLSWTGAFIYSVFFVELIAWFDFLVVLGWSLKRTNRTHEADGHEARLRTGEQDHVDVFIATYNEEEDVLIPTIDAACALDWPKDKLHIHVLDDGRREWLKDLAQRKGVLYKTRADNKGAKAGNINAALEATHAPFILVLDADFCVDQNFLYRTIGFFEDPKIGIVQVPHSFRNPDPALAHFGLEDEIGDNQRLFFNGIMPSRDGWDVSFCCGSNGVLRREAIESVGGLPLESVTEDMALTLNLLRAGYITRYLDEPLAYGLAPESLLGLYVQRIRWSKGAIQLAVSKAGCFGPGLTWIQRVSFLPIHWFSQSLGPLMAVLLPILYLWFGIPPIIVDNPAALIGAQFATIFAAVLFIGYITPQRTFPLLNMAENLLTGFRILPTLILTLLKPHGHTFSVTPKGKGIAQPKDWAGFWTCLGLLALTIGGLFYNTNLDRRIIDSGSTELVVAGWAVVNMVVLLVAATIALTQVKPEIKLGKQTGIGLRHYFKMTRAIFINIFTTEVEKDRQTDTGSS